MSNQGWITSKINRTYVEQKLDVHRTKVKRTSKVARTSDTSRMYIKQKLHVP
jgi:hypothetical protein